MLQTALALFLGLTSNIGTNIDSVSDSSPVRHFCDAWKSIRGYGTPTCAYCSPKETQPAGDFGVVVYTGFNHPEEKFQLKFNGKATVKPSASNAKLSTPVYYEATDATVIDIVSAKDSQLFLIFTNTQNVRNVSLIRDGCEGTFNPQFLESLKGYTSIRYMDLLKTNKSPIKTWADRKLVTELQTGPRGVALEYVAELANLTDTDAWVNIPILADDNYITEMAKLLKAQLKPHLKVYIEISNEVWNGIFTQLKENVEAAKAEVASGHIDLCMGDCTKDTNTWYWGRRRVAKRLLRATELFSTQIGSDRVRAVLAGQYADPSVARAGLQYIEKYAGQVSSKIYGIASAPYFATKIDTTSTIETVLAGLRGSVDSNKLRWAQDPPKGDGTATMAQLAKFHGVKHLAYEAGQHLTGEGLAREAQTRPEMEGLYYDYLTNWSKMGGAELMHFVNHSGWGKHGYWGLTNEYGLETPKTKAMNRVLAEQTIEQCRVEQAEITALAAQIVAIEAALKRSESLLEQANFYLNACKSANQSCMAERDLLQEKIAKIAELLR